MRKQHWIVLLAAITTLVSCSDDTTIPGVDYDDTDSFVENGDSAGDSATDSTDGTGVASFMVAATDPSTDPSYLDTGSGNDSDDDVPVDTGLSDDTTEELDTEAGTDTGSGEALDTNYDTGSDDIDTASDSDSLVDSDSVEVDLCEDVVCDDYPDDYCDGQMLYRWGELSSISCAPSTGVCSYDHPTGHYGTYCAEGCIDNDGDPYCYSETEDTDTPTDDTDTPTEDTETEDTETEDTGEPLTGGCADTYTVSGFGTYYVGSYCDGDALVGCDRNGYETGDVRDCTATGEIRPYSCETHTGDNGSISSNCVAPPPECLDDEWSCDGSVVRECIEGTWIEQFDCVPNHSDMCVINSAGNAYCVAFDHVCKPYDWQCGPDGVQRCSVDGRTWDDLYDCLSDEVCVADTENYEWARCE